MSPEEKQSRHKAAQVAGEGALATVEGYMEDAFKPALKGAPRTARYVIKAAPKLGGGIYTAAQILTAKDKLRAGVGAVGGLAGGLGGAAVGAATGPAAVVASPLLAAAGSATGQELAEDLYDAHAAKVERLIRQGAGTAKAWMKARGAEVAANAGQMMAPYWPIDELNRTRRR